MRYHILRRAFALGMLAQLHACHLAPNTFLIVYSGHRVRNCAHHRQQATSSVCSRSSTTAAAAEPPRRGWRTDYVSGLGALLSNNQLPQAVELLESCLDSQHRVHGVATGELLEGVHPISFFWEGPSQYDLYHFHHATRRFWTLQKQASA